MQQYSFANARHAVAAMASIVPQQGDKVSPRGQATRELQHVTMEILDSRQCLATDMRRKFNSKLAAAETLQLIGGFADPKWMIAVAPTYLNFTGGAMTGAYGPRLMSQLPKIVEMLRADRDTRQAVATIWEPERDLHVSHGDRPCTVYISFMIRDGKLIMSTYMRSQDIYLGLTYDLVMFGQLHLSVSNVLGIRTGSHVHTVQSLHAYERDFPRLREIIWPDQDVHQSPRLLRGLGSVNDDWEDVQHVARTLAYGTDADIEDIGPLTDTERWFRDQSEAARAHGE